MSLWSLLLSSSAEADIAEAALWYEGRQQGLGNEFVAEVESVLEKLKQDPERFRLHYPAQRVRRVLTKRFPYYAYYYLEGRLVRVFAVVHAARHERVWRSRL